MLARVVDVFGGMKSTSDVPDLKVLHAKIGQLTLENDFFGKRAYQGWIAERNGMIDRTHTLPLVRQCQILELARSTASYQPCPVSPDDLALMRRLGERHLNLPFAGSRRLSTIPQCDGQPVGRRRVSTLMKRMGIHTLYRKPHTSKRHPTHPIYPYLLRHLTITRFHHVWAADIISIPMQRGFASLFAVIDWARRRVLSWRLSNILTTDFCKEAVQEAFNRHGTPAIFNTDQGCQFTCLDFTCLLKDHGIQVSMD